ncbi:MAG: transglutaminase family protein [Planctomycetaceae bacterium]
MRQLTTCVLLLAVTTLANAQNINSSPSVDDALKLAGSNRTQIQMALDQVPVSQKRGMEFLVRWMPESDLKTLSADFLLENVRLAYEVREKTQWGKNIPEAIFLNDVLPYGNVNEPRHAWRADFVNRFLPVVAECKTPSEAAQKLNETVFKTLNVRYSTKRQRADQSPKESMQSGLASCTGLSIILTNACRAVGVPARLVGIPKWANKRGNHTWIEVWDQEWHFTGAAEPSGQGLNHTWFQADAAQALPDSELSAIYAASYKSTGRHFPLVWAPGMKSVNAVNVTHRYLPKAKANASRLMVRVWSSNPKERVAADVKLTAVGQEMQAGRSRDTSFDTNDILAFEVAAKKQYEITVSTKTGATVVQKVSMENRKQVIVDVMLPSISER